MAGAPGLTFSYPQQRPTHPLTAPASDRRSMQSHFRASYGRETPPRSVLLLLHGSAKKTRHEHQNGWCARHTRRFILSSMTTTLTPSRPSPASSKGGQPRRLIRLRAALIHPMLVRAPRSGAEGSVPDLPSGSVEAESSPVLDPGSMARSAKAASRPICTWVSTRPDGGGLEMRLVSPPAPEPAQRGGD